MSGNEPTSEAAVAAYVEAQLLARDPFIEVARLSDAHREQHGCDAFPSRPGHLLATFARALQARRVLEIGGGFGYSTLWLADGAAPDGVVETIEADPSHAATLREHAEQYGFVDRVVVHEGTDADVLPGLQPPYDLAFYDAEIPGPELVDHLQRLLRPGGIVIASNIFLGRYVPDHPDLPRAAAFRERMLDGDGWQTAFANAKLVAVRR
jgi:predicted O-methyltransferase YrrM